MISDKTYILRIVEKVGDEQIGFICNKGNAYIDSILQTKIIQWFGYSNAEDITSYQWGVDLLQVLDICNDNLQNQKIINQVKKQWIDAHNQVLYNDEVLCNSMLNNKIRDISKTLLFNYCVIYNTIERMQYREIYDTIKKIWWTPSLKANIKLNRYELMKFDPMEYGVKEYCITMMFRDYLLERMNKRERLPLGGYNIFIEIHKVLSNTGIRRKLKIKQYYDENTGLSN